MTKIEEMIKTYLDRVRIYLPIDSDDVLIEIRTHILEEAEKIAEGPPTPGSVLMAIERIGKPQTVANEYAGTNKSIGPIPIEFKEPLLRMISVLLGVGIAFISGSYILNIVLTQAVLFPFGAILNVALLVIINLVFAFIIIAVIFAIQRKEIFPEKDKIDRTEVEEVLTLGVEAFKPKTKVEMTFEVIFGIIAGLVFLLPQIHVYFTSAFVQLIPLIAAFNFLSAFLWALTLWRGENNLSLLVGIVYNLTQIMLAMLFTSIAFPLVNVIGFFNGQWSVISIEGLISFVGALQFLSLDLLWLGIVWLIVVTNTWGFMISLFKIAMYLRQGKTLWWKGRYGDEPI